MLQKSNPFDLYNNLILSYCSWGSQGKNTEVVCHSLLQWTMFCPLVNPKGNKSWIFIWRAEAPILRPPDAKSWRWERLKAEEDDKGWDDWMASPTQWTRVWANSGRWWRTGKSGMLQFMELQRVGHNLATEQQQIPSTSLDVYWMNKIMNEWLN